jgi:methionyl-tRNA formyltransferase
MGTPDFAVASLKKLVENNCNIVAVITAPDRPAGRGQKLHETPVKQYAVSVGLPVLQPEKLKNSEFLETLRSYKADLQIVVAFRMLPEIVWAMPPLGTFNLHGSLLPQYRGAAPINWAVINGEKETGVTTFFIEKEIDTGKIIFKETLPISEDATAGTMHDELMEIGANLVLKTVRAIEAGDFPQEDQSSNETTLKAAPKIFKEDCEIDWTKPSEAIRNFIRGLSPYPAAWTLLDGKVLKLFSTNYVSEESCRRSNDFFFRQKNVSLCQNCRWFLGNRNAATRRKKTHDHRRISTRLSFFGRVIVENIVFVSFG